MSNAITDYVMSEAHLAHMVAAPVRRLTSGQVLVRYRGVGMSTHVEKVLIGFLTNWNGASGPANDNCASAVLE